MTMTELDVRTDAEDATGLGAQPQSHDQSVASSQGTVARRRPPKRNKWLDRWGWYEMRPEGAWSTTRQGEALNLATTRRSTRYEGLITGLNLMSHSTVIVDPFALYGSEIENINIAVVGDIGKAKSSLIKTATCWRQVTAGRQVVVIDKKRQGNRGGEYSVIADALGVPSIRFKTGGDGARLNLMDPAISAGGDHGDGVVPAGQEALIAAVLEDTMQRTLSETEIAALNLALRLVNDRAARDGHEPILAEVAEVLLSTPAEATAEFGEVWTEDARLWGRDPGLALRRLCEGDLKGLVDSATSSDVRQALDYPFVHFDVSDLPNKGPALRVVMTVINTWLANVLAARSAERKQTLLIVEEGWHIAEGSTGRVFRDNMKLSRGLGLSTVSAFHHISDLPEDSPARALMREAGIVFLYGQDRVDDAADAVRMYHLPPGSESLLMGLEKGQCLVKYGKADPILMQHVRSEFEVALTNTDEVIRGAA
ncbi:ATP/GTP-binding protein [Rhodococcus sp. NPDC003318]|uniref:ATP/GTP-binding protein n=1 Tax=Rhodococcus sp. NPDC003318 TaxID=3364503 RepID=UPI0036A85117